VREGGSEHAAGAQSEPCEPGARVAVVATTAAVDVVARASGRLVALRSGEASADSACHSPNNIDDVTRAHPRDRLREPSPSRTPRKITSSESAVSSGMRTSVSNTASPGLVPVILSSARSRRVRGFATAAADAAASGTAATRPNRFPRSAFARLRPNSDGDAPDARAKPASAAAAPRFAGRRARRRIRVTMML
jgi:hypothetical protein